MLTVKELKEILEKHSDDELVTLELDCTEYGEAELYIGNECILDEEV